MRPPAKQPIIPLAHLTLRKAREEDYEDLCELFAELDVYHRAALPDFFVKPEGPARNRDYVAEFLTGDTKALFVAALGPRLVGFATLIRTDRPPTPVRPARIHVEIDSLVVASAYRRRGIATKLIRHGEAWAKGQGAARLVLSVHAFNETARQFYAGNGFEIQTLTLMKALT